MTGFTIEGDTSLKGSIRYRLKKCSASLYGGVLTFTSGSQCAQRRPRIADVFVWRKFFSAWAVTWWEDHDLYMTANNAVNGQFLYEYYREDEVFRDSS